MAEARPIPDRHLPHVDDPATAPFWAGCRAGELRIPRCDTCGRLVWYPAAACPDCGGERHTWTRVSGRGRIFTWVRVHRAFLPGFGDRVPFVTVLVELDEDPRVRLASFLHGIPGGGPRIGMAVEVMFERVTDQVTLPAFRCRP